MKTRPAPIAIFGYSHIALQTALHLAAQGQPVELLLKQAQREELPPQLPAEIQLRCLPHLRPDSLPELPAGCQTCLVANEDEQFILRLITRLFNQALGRDLEERFPQIQVLSVSELAAPFFAAAAFFDQVEQAWLEQGQLLVRVCQQGQSLTLQVSAQPGTELQPAQTRQVPARRPLPPADPLLLGVLALVILCGSLFFSLRHGLPLGDAVYFVVTTLTTTGYGDYSLKDYPFSAKLAGMVLMLARGSLFAVLFALLTDKLFRLPLDAALGRRRIRSQGHIILCGAGTVGMRVAEAMRLTGAETVVIERNPEGRFNAQIRALGFALVIGDATLESTLEQAGLAFARTLIYATEEDLVNLQIALNARALYPHLRIVVRSFDQDFAARMPQNFDLDIVLSSSALAAQAFASAARQERT